MKKRGRPKRHEIVKSIRLGMSEVEAAWLLSQKNQSELVMGQVRKVMSQTKTLNPKIEEVVARAIARLSVEGVVLNCVRSRSIINIPELDIVQINEHQSKIIPCGDHKIIPLGIVGDIDGRSESHWYLVDCLSPFALVVDKSCLDEDDSFRFKDAENIPEWMLAQLAIEQKPNG